MNKKISPWQIIITAVFMITLPLINSCSSNDNEIDEDALPLTFSTPATVTQKVAGGSAEIVITVSGGTLPYTFYVIPETQWLAGDQMHDMLVSNDFSRLYRYTYTRRLYGSHTCIIEVTPGTASVPRNYWVTVQDRTEKGTVSGTNLYSWWKKVAAYGL